MNIKLSVGAVRIRVSRGELDTLLATRALTLEVALPRHHVFRVNVRPAVIGGWSLESDPTGLWITIPLTDLESLAQSLPKRDGLQHPFELTNGGSVLVSFEVDVKDRDRGERTPVTTEWLLLFLRFPGNRAEPNVATILNSIPMDAIGEGIGGLLRFADRFSQTDGA